MTFHDPWLSGDQLPGVTFRHNSVVEIVKGELTGQRGYSVALVLGPDPVYTVELESGAGDVHLPQSWLRAAA